MIFFTLQKERKLEQAAGQVPDPGARKPVVELYRNEVIARIRGAVMSTASLLL